MSPKHSFKPIDGGLTLAESAAILRRRWKTAFLAGAAAFGMLAAYAYLSTPIYSAAALVELDKPADLVFEGAQATVPDDTFLATQPQLVVTDAALRRVYEELRLGETPEFAAGAASLRPAVSSLGIPRTRLCRISVESVSPGRAADIANALARAYLQKNLEDQLARARAAARSLAASAKGPDGTLAYESLPAVLGSPVVQNLKEEIVKAEAALTDARGKFTDRHPAVQARLAEIELLQKARDREVSTIVRGLETSLLGSLRPNNALIVDPAVPPTHPARPRKELALLLGVVIGLIAAFLAAVVKDGLDQTVRNDEDLERSLGLPVLGLIPEFSGRRRRLIPEAFRELRTMLSVADGKAAAPSILVTSAVEDEGKTFVAANLAVSLSKFGEKVLLIDGDLRHPSLHARFGLDVEMGLSDLLTGRASDTESLLVQPADVPNLTVLPAGKGGADAAEKLGSSQLEGLLEWARGRFDRVIVDCPPVFPGGDVLLWGRHVSSSILVSACGRTPITLARLAGERLRASRIDLLGGVLNRAGSGMGGYAYGNR
jgi:capsular exopolysaccharide synthesis family protein